MSTFEFSLSPDLEAFVNTKIAEGQYETAGEVLHDALLFLRERDRMRQMRLQDLRQEIELGLDQIRRGEGAPLDMEGIKQEVLRRSQERA